MTSTDTYYGQPAQVETVGPRTRYISLSIGGDDIGSAGWRPHAPKECPIDRA